MLLVVLGLAGAAWAAYTRSPVLVLVDSVLLGAAYGVSQFCGLLRIQQVARPEALGSTIAAYQVLSYLGFAFPFAMAWLNEHRGVSPTTTLMAMTGLALVSAALVVGRRAPLVAPTQATATATTASCTPTGLTSARGPRGLASVPPVIDIPPSSQGEHALHPSSRTSRTRPHDRRVMRSNCPTSRGRPAQFARGEARAIPSAAVSEIRVRPARKNWSAIVALAFGTGALVAAEFLLASVLPAMAADLDVTEGTAGLAVTATSVAGALTAPTIALLLPRTDRRAVLVGLLATATVSNLAVAAAPGFAILLLSRLLLGIAIAGYWFFAFGAGTTAVPGKDHVVSAAIAMGVTSATIVGMPVAAVAADHLDWRLVFAGAAALSALAVASLLVTLPSVPAHPSAGFAMLRRALSNRRLMAGVMAVVLVGFGNFAAFPFIRLAIAGIAPAAAATWLLLSWGIGGMVGNIAAGRFSGRLRLVAGSGPLILGISLFATTVADTWWVGVVAVVLWGFAFNTVPVATQLWVTRVEPERAEAALSLQVTAFQVAITLGSATGAVLVDSYGVASVLLVGAVFAAASGTIFLLLRVPRT